MINIDQIIGDIVFISFNDPSSLSEIGISELSGHYLIKGYDQIGLWLEHPGLIFTRTEDDNGRPLAADKQTSNKVPAAFMVHWSNVKVIMNYPDREGYDLPSEYDKDFGFRFNNKENNL
tara:strand:+ start:467 stop:823 length:357 start_codon:yes stop_codon:yes gene_type:complete